MRRDGERVLEGLCGEEDFEGGRGVGEGARGMGVALTVGGVGFLELWEGGDGGGGVLCEVVVEDWVERNREDRSAGFGL